MGPGQSSDPQAADWGGLSWSPWTDLDQAVRDHLIPATAGLYASAPAMTRACSTSEKASTAAGCGLWHGRCEAPGELLSRLACRRSHQAPASRPLCRPVPRRCHDAGCVIEVSWAGQEHPDRAQRRAKEADLGHASPALTLRVYAHVLPGDQRAAAARFAALIGGAGS